MLMPLKNYGDDSIFYFIKPRGLKFKRRGVYSNAGSNTYLFSIPKAKVLNCNREIICENMQILEKWAIDAMVLFDKFFDHKLDGESQIEPGRNGRKCPLIQKRTDCLGRMAVTYWRYFILGRFDINQITGS